MSIFTATPAISTSVRATTVDTYRKRPEHTPRGEPCEVCGLPGFMHRLRQKKKTAILGEKRKKNRFDLPFLGIDGEGGGRHPHLYTLLGLSDETGKEWYLEDPNGLHTEPLLEFILRLPQDNMIFAYAFNYDLTKILADIDDETLYLLFRPELRARKGAAASRGPRPVFWRGYGLNLQGSKFGIFKDGRSIVIWDIFKFFQGKFVNALIDWKVGNPELWKRMKEMKDLRGTFDAEMALRVREYCLEECLCMAKLARKLLQGHTDAGLELTSFYGAGSSASAMLTKMRIKEQMGEPPEEMELPIASAFFGGRFENSVIGEIEGPVYNYDISSAYPYQLYQLPCLLHAEWRKSKRRRDLNGARMALVRYSIRAEPEITDWAPFPFRDRDGNISYPKVSDGGWVWLPEFLAGERGWPKNVVFHEAWIYESDCECRPFKDIAHYYNERLRIGKEGAGIVMKLGCNSCYGKIAQSVGNGVFNSWAWAGMITAGCRGQLLDVTVMHKDRANLLMKATDGAFTRERLITPVPIDTGTGILNPKTGLIEKQLGGWEEKIIEQNVFIARPGIYFPMNPSKEQLKDCKGRGVGKSVVYDNWKLISDSWAKDGVSEPVTVANVTRFCGAKTSLTRTGDTRKGYVYSRANGHGGLKDEHDKEWPSYGEWVQREVKMSFDPLPKRDCVAPDGRSLVLRDSHGMSVPYKKASSAEETSAMRIAYDEMTEQPDCDYLEME
jgi:hypothetical protein